MNVLTLDVETTTSNTGNPFDYRNKCVMVGLKYKDTSSLCFNCLDELVDYREFVQFHIDRADLLVGFNIKFDLHWLRKLGIDFTGKRIFDCQIAEFLLSKQQNKYPSLNDSLERYGLPLKLDVVKTEYWDKDINTDEIPTDVLEEYLNGDLVGTEEVYKRQLKELKEQGLYALFKLQCMDLLVLEEMEWNGIVFNTEKARQRANEIDKELSQLEGDINGYTSGAPVNFNSDDDVSCLLYGGIIQEDVRIPVGVFKTGAKVGQTRYSILVKEYTLPRLIEPLKGTERLKTGDTKETARYWLTNDDVLRSLQPTKEGKTLLGLLKKYKKLEKLRGTYLIGWSDLIDTMGWQKDRIYGNLNQCTVITGRLSSTKPNLQNADPTTKIFCESRYN